jgi:ribonuclease-3
MNIKPDKQQKLLQLAAAIGHTFSDLTLLFLALTHKSCGAKNNERLEFLGDSVLHFTISSKIYTQFTKLTEGELTRIRSKLVSRDSLIDLATALELGNYVLLGDAERASGGMQRKSIWANTLEAIFGAIYLDAGIDVARQIILQLYKSKIAVVGSQGGVKKDPKTELQEWLQAKEHKLPEYQVIKVEGKPHKQTFHVECKVAEFNQVAAGADLSIRKAEQKAAAAMLALLIKVAKSSKQAAKGKK